MRRLRVCVCLLLASALGGCAAYGYPVRGSVEPVEPAAPAVTGRYGTGPGDYYEIDGRRYHVLISARGYREEGVASWYGPGFHGRPTSSGERFDQNAMTAAHRTLPLGTRVRVRHLATGRSAVVRINDRGPFKDPDLRIIDLSQAAAEALGIVEAGTAPVEVAVLAGG